MAGATMSRQQLMKTSWDTVAAAYDRELVPKFEPWLRETISAFTNGAIPPGPVFAPCCGAGNELLLLADALPAGNSILGVDLSEEMVAISNNKAAQAGLQGRVAVTAGDAAQPPAVDGLAGVFSVFGLQQLQPEPGKALHAWLKALKPGGKAAICYFPSEIEPEGPWHTYNKIVDEKRPPSEPAGPPWDEGMLTAVLELPGVQLVEDRCITHDMCWTSIEHMWQVMTECGPWHARKLYYGDAFMEEVKAELFARVPAGSLMHRPLARLLVFTAAQLGQARM